MHTNAWAEEHIVCNCNAFIDKLQLQFDIHYCEMCLYMLYDIYMYCSTPLLNLIQTEHSQRL